MQFRCTSAYLIVTLFNLGKTSVSLKREDPFCSLYVIEVGKGVIPHSKPEQKQRPAESQTRGYLEKYKFFWEWQRDLKGSSLLKAAKWQLIEVP